MKKEILRMDDITKKRENIVYLNHVYLNVFSGESVGLLGLSKTGKTLLMNILMGETDMNSGIIYIDDKPVLIRTAHEANLCGVHYINHISSLIDTFSIADNLFVMRREKKIFINRNLVLKRAADCLRKLGLQLDPQDNILNLSYLERLYVEIARAVAQNARVIILDHALNQLEEKELDQLFEVIERLKKLEISFLIVDYQIAPLMMFCERIFVLRKGMMAGEFQRENYDIKNITAAMVGDEITLKEMDFSFCRKKNSLLKINCIKKSWGMESSLEIFYGEMVGICVLSDMEKQQLTSFFRGEDMSIASQILYEGKEMKPKAFRKVVQNAFGNLTYQNALFSNLSLYDNVMLLANKTISNIFGMIPKSPAQYIFSSYYTTHLYNKIDVGKNNLCVDLNKYSECTIELTKYLASGKKLLICTDLSRSADVVTRQKLLTSISESVNENCAALFISSDIHELLVACNRIYFYSSKGYVGVMDKNDYGAEEILEYYKSFYLLQV